MACRTYRGFSVGIIGLLCGSIISLALVLFSVGLSRVLIVMMLKEMRAEWQEIQRLRNRLADSLCRGET